jgi:hypothetical protein
MEVCGMRTVNGYKIVYEEWETQKEAGRYNPALELHYKGKAYTLACGSTDDVNVFEDNTVLFVMSQNWGLEYCGLQVFDLDTDSVEPRSEVFFQEGFPDEGRGLPWTELIAINRCKALAQYL